MSLFFVIAHALTTIPALLIVLGGVLPPPILVAIYIMLFTHSYPEEMYDEL